MPTIDEIAASPALLAKFDTKGNPDFDDTSSEFLVGRVRFEIVEEDEHPEVIDLESGLWVLWPVEPAFRERALREITDGSTVLFQFHDGGAGPLRDFRVIAPGE